MKDFENYECEGQISIFDIYPKQCCGVEPWLELSTCVRWNPEKPLKFHANYICPVCLKQPIDEINWPIRSYGELAEATEEALRVWNDNKVKKIHKDYVEGIFLILDDIEKFKKKYGDKVICEKGKHRVYGEENEL